MDGLIDWVKGHEGLAATVGIGTLVVLVGSVLLTPWLVARIPADYFAQEEAPEGGWSKQHPAGRVALRIGRNVLGVVLILAGIAMLLLPGQGVLTILLGFLALDYPGKRRLELKLLRRRRVLRLLNWMRRRAHKEPLRVAGADFDCEEKGGAGSS